MSELPDDRFKRIMTALTDAEAMCLQGQRYTLSGEWFDDWLNKHQCLIDELESCPEKKTPATALACRGKTVSKSANRLGC